MFDKIYEIIKQAVKPVSDVLIASHVDQASTYASDIDAVFALVAILVGFWFFIAEGVLFFLIFRYRHREGKKALYVTGKEHKYTRWIHIPHNLILVCDVLIIIAAIRVWVDVKQELPEAEQTVRVIAQQWAWNFVHPGPDGKLDTDDDIAMSDELHVQVGTMYHYELESLDVLHDFSVPVFRLKHDAIPGRVITGWFEPTKIGTYDIQCAEMCGIGHGIMAARIVIESKEEHAAWMKTHSSGGGAATRVAAITGL